jgi:hypothetical protein
MATTITRTNGDGNDGINESGNDKTMDYATVNHLENKGIA